jgi:hypothetical protein
MKKLFFLFILLFCLSQLTYAQHKKWHYLFDGKSVKELRGYKMADFPFDAWKVEDVALVAQTGVPNVDFSPRKFPF